MEGFIPRNHKSLVIVRDWSDFAEWVEDSGYDESYLDVNDSKCYSLQQTYMEEQCSDK